MPFITVNFNKRISDEAIRSLQNELGTLAEVQEAGQQSYSLDFAAVALLVGFSANALQVADILNNWIKQRVPRGNEAVIRLSDGRTLELKANSDPDSFLK